MPWINDIDSADPLSTGLVSGGAAEFRTLKAAILERLNSIFVSFNANPLVPQVGLQMEGAVPPTSGGAGTGAGVANPGTRYYDTVHNICYMNIGTKAVPAWAPFLMGDTV